MSGFLVVIGVALLLGGLAAIGLPFVTADQSFWSYEFANESLSDLAPYAGGGGLAVGALLIGVGSLLGRKATTGQSARRPKMADPSPSRPYVVTEQAAKPKTMVGEKTAPTKREKPLAADTVFPVGDSIRPPPAPTPLTDSNMLDAVALNVGDSVVQLFDATSRFVGIEISFVTWNQRPSDYSLQWLLKNEQGITLSSGVIQAAQLSDWQKVSLPAHGGPGRFGLQIFSPLRPEPAANPVGLVVASLNSPTTPFAMKNGDPLAVPGGIQMWILGE